MLKIILFTIIIALILYLGESLLRLYKTNQDLDSIVVYKPHTKYKDKDNTKIIKKVNSFYKHGFG